jgi:hypothetical protein
MHLSDPAGSDYPETQHKNLPKIHFAQSFGRWRLRINIPFVQTGIFAG